MPVPSQLAGNLPNTLSSFIGRGHEINEIKRLFSKTRLLTLTGPGGCGKTRLGLWVAAEIGPSFKDGVWLVELAPLTDPELVTQTVCTAIGVREQPGLPLIAVLTAYLTSREMLLVMDNCEHLIAACARLTEALLHGAPHLKVLATSREALDINGETVWPVPPLSVPEFPLPGNTIGDPVALMNYEAPRLFIERASAASPSFTLTEQNATAVAEICRRLDGLPLAIEMAAARIRALSAEQIATRLVTHDRFELLTTGSRTASQRHHTLEATLDWGYALLPETERAVFGRLSVFAGSWTLDAAEQVCALVAVATPPDRSSSHVLDILSHLVDKSMVVVDRSSDAVRYHYHETMRQYASSKLDESGEIEIVRDRHLDYFVRWVEQAEPHFMIADQLAWLNRFESEHDNVRTALGWSLTAESRAEPGLRLAAASARFWRLRAYLSEGRMRITAALEHASAYIQLSQNAQSARTRARALIASANMAYLQSDYTVARTLCQESLALLQPLGPSVREFVAEALSLLGDVETEEGHYATASALLERALAIWQELMDARGQGNALMLLGWCAMRTGDYALAESWLEKSLESSRVAGNTTNIGFALAGLAEVALRLRRYERATRLAEEGLALHRENGAKWGLGTILGTLGWVALRQHDYKRMRTLLGESLAVRIETGDRGGIAWCLEKLAEGIIQEAQAAQPDYRAEDLHRAVTLFGTAASLRIPLGSAVDPADQHDYEQTLANLRSTLGEVVFAMHWGMGSRMSVEEAVDVALQEPQVRTNTQLPLSAQEMKQQFGGLTAREREVAALIALGKSNRQIATALVIGVKTAETYVTRILNKLGFDSRVQIATWAVEIGLAPQAHLKEA